VHVRSCVTTLVAVAVAAAGCGRLGFDRLPLDDAPTTEPADADADPCAAISAGLVGAWPLDAPDVIGTTVHDRSGNGRDGTLIGTPAAVVAPGRLGEALDFAGTSLSYVDLASVPLDSTAGAFTTVSLWFRNDNANADEALACLPTGPVAGPPRYSLWLTNRIGPASLCINTGSGDCWGITDAGLIGRWVHIVAIYANGPTVGGSLYVDGARVDTACRFGTCNQTRVAQAPFSIACSDPAYAWHGLLDEVRVFDRALEPAEVLALYQCAGAGL
jgi:Concanavalin A-like lectin/glucanases superfamily